MLTRLYMDQCFTHMDRTIIFDKGLTAITGQNESGKSLIAEMIRFALFGSKALRGEATDYKKLHVELDFVVKGQDYQVIRKRGNAQLWLGGEMIASGASVVNKAVPELFGYDLMVFDTANNCNQGAIEALSNMRPAERKRMVDQTIGLNVLDDLLVWVGEQALVHRRLVDALEPTIEAPLTPEKPKGYQTSAILRTTIAKLTEQATRAIQLTTLLDNEPADPGERPSPIDSDELSRMSNMRKSDMGQIELLSQKIAGCEPPTMTPKQIEKKTKALAEWKAWVDFVAGHRKSEYTSDALDGMKLLNDQWEIYNDCFQRIERLRKIIDHVDMVTCPKCNHEFALYQTDLDDMRQEMAEIKLPAKPGSKSAIDNPQIQLERRFIEAWEKAPDAAPDPDVTRQELLEQSVLNERLALRRGWETELEKLKSFLSVEIDPQLILDQDLWQRREGVWSTYMEKVDAWRVELKPLTEVHLERDLVQNLLEHCLTYETLKAEFDRLMVRYEGLMVELETHRMDAKAYAEAKIVILDVKTEIKTLLLPSLNTVASQFLHQMTGGERSIVDIDEEFEIRIDGTKIGKLSGSGKAVSNLAVRLALGQVLTNRVFSVFIADEVDASMDDDRAAYTAECLRRLTDLIGQVFLITHKYPEADQTLEMTK